METSDGSFVNSFISSKWLNPDWLFDRGVEIFQEVFRFLANIDAQIINFYNMILFFLALFFITIIAYCVVRIFEIRNKEKKHLKHELAEYAHYQAERAKKAEEGEAVSRNPQWVKTLNYLFSQHPSDWKLAVLEADAMLESLLDQLGFKGESMGDKLKAAASGDFKNTSSAWEAHAVRNKIAHEGTSFELSQQEAKRIIAIYEQIFRGYGYI